MKRIFFILSVVLSVLAGTVAAHPARQSDPSVITADNIERLELLGVYYDDENGLSFTEMFLSADNRVAVVSEQNRVDILSIIKVAGSPWPTVERDSTFTVEADECEGPCFVTSVALKDNHVAVGTVNGIFMIFDSETGERLLMHREHQGYRINAITVDAEGSRFISIDANGTVGYAIQMGENSYFQERVSPVSDSPLLAVTTDPNSSKMAVAGGSPLVVEPNTTIYVWDNEDVSASVSILPITELEGSQYPVYALAFSPDGRMLVSYEGDEFGDHSMLRFWDVETGQEIARMSFQPLDRSSGISTESIIFSPDGSLMGVKVGLNNLFLFDTADLPTTGQVDYSDLTYHSVGMGQGEIMFSADGRYMVTNATDVIQVRGIFVEE